MEQISTYLKGRVSLLELFDRPFRELHELYRIVYNRAEMQRLKDEEEKKREEEEKKSELSKSNKSKQTTKQPTDAIGVRSNKNISMPSPLESEALEDALEELAEGGLM